MYYTENGLRIKWKIKSHNKTHKWRVLRKREFFNWLVGAMLMLAQRLLLPLHSGKHNQGQNRPFSQQTV